MGVEHASARIIDRYARGLGGGDDLTADELWAVEAHLEMCRVCRDRLAAVVASDVPEVAALVGSVRDGLEPRLDVPVARRRYRPVRVSSWLTPTMVPWVGMVVSVTLLALLLDLVGGGYGFGVGAGRVSVVLLLAPVLPVLGVAASWSQGLDPAYELTASVPRAGLQLVLRRTASVLAVVVPALLVGGWATGVPGVTAVQWLLPCLAFTSTTLALGGVVGVTRAAVAVVAVWAAVVLTPTVAADRTTFALQAGGLPVWGLVLALGVGVVFVRRGAYSVLGAHR
ncbi:zf-HC2 domain-containing protein [Streptomyces sp. N50]|uniref:zf-HC2 domain-containing protein n=1 Tax=Streptomyces sp. N50 TaxID=3081765 RepID=UPI00296249BD|nr:zf-HC2 domain-containing protein [Streptomyces sp. N50]WOX15745.1 zf-HC2 domain-containing protein [Streptomyces sp. N50]